MYWSRLGRNLYGTILNIHLILSAYLYFWVVLCLKMMCVFINTNPPFQKTSAAIVSEIDNVSKFALITTAIIERNFNSEYLFRTSSVNTNLVTSLQLHSNLCYFALPFLANCGTVPFSLIFTPIAALLQAVLQENTELLRNGLVEMRNKV